VSNDETAAQQQPGGDPDQQRMRDQNLRNARLPDGGEKTGPGQDDAGLHDMGGNIGPASIRGPGAAPGGRPDDDAGHVTAGTDWVPDDEDDPDLGSGRVDAPDDGYLSDEGTAR
jgi:hypothetical protein